MTPRRLRTVLRTLREQRGLTQDQVASRAGVTKPYLSQLESGARKNPSLPVLKRLAKALGVPVTELLE
jgi:XRE family transcriptional regulator, master regulator for biofilm formation